MPPAVSKRVERAWEALVAHASCGALTTAVCASVGGAATGRSHYWHGGAIERCRQRRILPADSPSARSSIASSRQVAPARAARHPTPLQTSTDDNGCPGMAAAAPAAATAARSALLASLVGGDAAGEGAAAWAPPAGAASTGRADWAAATDGGGSLLMSAVGGEGIGALIAAKERELHDINELRHATLHASLDEKVWCRRAGRRVRSRRCARARASRPPQSRESAAAPREPHDIAS